MRQRRRQRGSTLVEAALTVLIFFTVVFLTIEMGHAWNTYEAITDAAREGARYAVAPDATGALPTDVSAWMHRNYLDRLYLSKATVSVYSVTSAVNGVNTTFTEVEVSMPVRFAMLPFLKPITVSTCSVMRNETN